MSDYGAIDLSGAIVTASGVAACRPRALTVHGRSTQDGTPTPSAPVPIVSVAGQLYQQTVYAAGATYTTAGIAVTHNADGTCTVSGTATGNAWLWGGGSSAVAGYYVTLPAGTYTVCGSHSVAAQKMVGSTVSSLVGQTAGSATFTLAEETLVKAVPVIPSGTTVSGDTAWVAVYAGSTAYPYVPYGHAGLWARGKNLLPFAAGTRTSNGVTFAVSEDGTITASGTSTGLATLHSTLKGHVLPAGTYTLSGCPSGGSDSTYRIDLYQVGSSVAVAVDYGSGATFTVGEGMNVDYCRIRIPNGASVSGKVFRPMLRLASAGAEFEPYTATVTPIDLDGHELRSLPDGTRDELTVDQYGHAVLTKRVGSVTYDGTESWSLQSGTYPFIAVGSSTLGAVGGKPLMSNLLAYTGQITVDASGDGLSLIASGATLRIRATGYATADAWKAKLAETPMTVLYPLATPQAIDLGTVDMANLTSPDLTAWVTGSPEFELTALLKTGRSTVMWDGEELGAGWTFVSDRREQLLPTDVATVDVPGRDGALFGGVTRAVRQVTLALYVLGPVGERAPHVRELAARLAVDGPRPLMFSDEAPLWRMAVPNAESESEVYYDAEGYTDVEFVCPDPWLYGEEGSVTVPSGGSVTFTVGGTAPTWPTITASATGSSQGTWILRLDDSSKGVYAAIASGVTRPVVADCDARTLTVNDTTSMLAPSYDWPELTPGTHTLAMTAGTGAATVTWTERWW